MVDMRGSPPPRPNCGSKRSRGCELLYIHFNNPSALRESIRSLGERRNLFARTTVFDNGSGEESFRAVEQLASELDCRLIRSRNLGWGGAINAYIHDNCAYDWLAVTAHDATFIHFSEDALVSLDDTSIAAAGSQYPDPTICTWSPARGVRAVAGDDRLPQVLLHGTFCVFRVDDVVAAGGFDENFFIYGCEAEIFMREPLRSKGKLILENVVVGNPTTDSPTSFVTCAFAINSLYLARKHGGWLGYGQRAIAVIFSAFKQLAAGRAETGLLRLSCLLWSLKHGGRAGFRQYLGRLTEQANKPRL